MQSSGSADALFFYPLIGLNLMTNWQRIEGETTKAYHAFCLYLDLGVNRSIEKAWRKYKNNTKTVPGYFKQWSVKYNWVNRAKTYDDYQRQQYEKAMADEFESARQNAREKRQKTVRAMQTLLNRVLSEYSDQLNPTTLNQLANATRIILDQSRQEFNDMPTQRTDITSGGDRLDVRIYYDDND